MKGMSTRLLIASKFTAKCRAVASIVGEENKLETRLSSGVSSGYNKMIKKLIRDFSEIQTVFVRRCAHWA